MKFPGKKNPAKPLVDLKVSNEHNREENKGVCIHLQNVFWLTLLPCCESIRTHRDSIRVDRGINEKGKTNTKHHRREPQVVKVSEKTTDAKVPLLNSTCII